MSTNERHEHPSTPTPTLRGFPMRRNFTLLACVIAAAAGYTTAAYAQTAKPSAHVAHAATVQLHHTSIGTILTSSSGLTLYEFTRDRADADSCVKVSGCSRFWPALESSGTPTAGAGVKASLLSTIRLPGGGRQVTYAGHPLYLYSGDSSPADTSYVGAQQFGGKWYALDASGRFVK
jgi:predicted lipoprotein with Yx(FWY)xxD motif